VTDALSELAGRSAMPAAEWDDVGVPAVVPWQELRARFIDAIRSEFAKWIAPDQAHFREQLVFALGRFDEGVRLVQHLRQFALGDRDVTALDIGAGNGGVGFAFANDPRNTVFALDIVPNPQAVGCRRLLDSSLQLVTGDAGALPFASDTFDLVVLSDVLEHLPAPRAAGPEIMRILRPGGVCFISTPARLSFALRHDPHYGIRSLALLPNEAQRFVVNRVLRRRVVGHDGRRVPAYDVEHLFWNAREIARLFPAPKTIDVLYRRDYRPPGRFSRYWLRHPSAAVEQLAYKMRHWFFGHILIYKGAPPPGAQQFDRIESAL